MKDSLQRLKRLQQQLETLHKSTAEVLSASQDLLRKIETGDAPAPRKSARKKARRGKRVTSDGA